MTPQDTTHCMICGDRLHHKPRLGDWIAHPQCEHAVTVRVVEAEGRGRREGARGERERILKNVNEIACAISDPGAFVTRLGVGFPGFDADDPERLTDWQTRAVAAVISGDGRVERGTR